eukprot:3639831-Rhodomonas_salina.1
MREAIGLLKRAKCAWQRERAESSKTADGDADKRGAGIVPDQRAGRAHASVADPTADQGCLIAGIGCVLSIRLALRCAVWTDMAGLSLSLYLSLLPSLPFFLPTLSSCPRRLQRQRGKLQRKLHDR